MKTKRSKESKQLNNLLFKVLLQPRIINGVLFYGLGETADITTIKHLNDMSSEGDKKYNREAIKKHLEKIYQSIVEFGFSGGIVVVIYQGVPYFVDGYHRALALYEQTKLIVFQFIYMDSFNDMMDFTIRLNTTAKNWQADTFFGNFMAREKYPYKLIDKHRNKPLPKTIITALVSNLSVPTSKRIWKEGTIEIGEKIPVIEKRISLMIKFLTIYNTYKFTLRVSEGLLKFIETIGWDEFEMVYETIAKKSLNFTGNNVIGVITNTRASQFEHLFKYLYNDLKKELEYQNF